MNTALYVLVVNLCNQLLFPLISPGPHNTTIFQQKLTKLWDLFVGTFLLISQLKPKNYFMCQLFVHVSLTVPKYGNPTTLKILPL